MKCPHCKKQVNVDIVNAHCLAYHGDSYVIGCDKCQRGISIEAITTIKLIPEKYRGARTSGDWGEKIIPEYTASQDQSK